MKIDITFEQLKRWVGDAEFLSGNEIWNQMNDDKWQEENFDWIQAYNKDGVTTYLWSRMKALSKNQLFIEDVRKLFAEKGLDYDAELETLQLEKPVNQCHADTDGDCNWSNCPQLRDKEPETSKRDCPLWVIDDEL